MLDWTDLLLGYGLYLAGLAWVTPRFARARLPAIAMAAAAAAVWAGWLRLPGEATAVTLAARVAVPSLALLAAYRASGAFFLAPHVSVERWLLATDAAALRGTGLLGAYRRAPALLREIVELCYLLVYANVPLGAVVLMLGSRAEAIEGYWAAVFAAELACYAMLPWVQTRPPRAIEREEPVYPLPVVRRLNLAVLEVGSIQVNTFPSAHAAGAVAIALSLGSAVPATGPAALALAAGIVGATVLGRYHYLADSVIGVLVGIAAWWLLGA